MSEDDSCYVYLNPHAPQSVKDLITEHFWFAPRVSAEFLQRRTGGFTDDGPALANYAAAILAPFPGLGDQGVFRGSRKRRAR